MQEPQSNIEEKVNPGILKDDFSPRTEPSIFTSIEPLLLDRSNKTSWVFPALKSTSHFLPQSTVSHRSDSSSELYFKFSCISVSFVLFKFRIQLCICTSYTTCVSNKCIYLISFFSLQMFCQSPDQPCPYLDKN